MVTNNNCLISVGSVDDTNDIVHRRNQIASLSLKMKLNARSRTRAVISIETT